MLAVLLAAALAADPIPIAVPPPPELPPPAVSEGAGGAQSAVVALVRSGNRIGSGVLVSDVGLIISTARNFSHLGDAVSGTLLDGRTVNASVAYVDPSHDLAVLRLPTGFAYGSVAVAPQLPEVGAALQVISNAGAAAWNVSAGALNARFAVRDGKSDPLFFRLQVVNPAVGEGGAVLDAQGRLVGILASESGSGSEWAVTTDALRSLIASIKGVNEYTLSLDISPPGATVLVDDRDAGVSANAPIVLSHLPNGPHTVKLRFAGAAEDLLTVDLFQHQAVSLQRHLSAGGQVELASNARADVWVDGTSRGTVPLLLSLPAGSHHFDLRAPGYELRSEDVVVAEGAHQAVTIDLTPIIALLSLSTVPAGAQVTANGEPLGPTPLHDVKVPAGTVTVGISYADKHSYSFKLTLAPNESRDLGTYRLEDPFGWLEPKGLPPGTKVVIDAGQAHPISLYERVPIGDHRIEVLAPDYYAYSEQLSVADAQATVLDPPLRLYDHLSPRKTGAAIAAGLGTCLGLVAVGFVTDASTNKYAPVTAMLSLSGLATGLYLLATSASPGEAGWSEQGSYTPAEAAK